MNVELKKSFRFEAAHCLPFAPEGHRCRNLHGHGYSVDIVVAGEVDAASGWLIDYGEIARLFEPVRKDLDHCRLNDIPGLESGTAEMVAVYIWKRLVGELPGLKEVRVSETTTSSCTFRGE